MPSTNVHFFTAFPVKVEVEVMRLTAKDSYRAKAEGRKNRKVGLRRVTGARDNRPGNGRAMSKALQTYMADHVAGSVHVGVPAFATWQASALDALNPMLAFTGVSHFTFMKEDFARMMPPSIPWPRVGLFHGHL
jgi:hypothetical protein